MTGIVQIQGGEIVSYDSQSWHYKPDPKSLKVTDEETFGKFQLLFFMKKMTAAVMSIEEYTEHLFGCNFKDDMFDPDNKEEHLEMALKLLYNYSWEDIYPILINHLYTKFNTPDDVINFANLYFYYGFADQVIPNPIEFISYLYYMVDMNIDKNWEDAGELFDSLAIDVLSCSGLVNIKDNPYYSPVNDKKILAGISAWKNKKAK